MGRKLEVDLDDLLDLVNCAETYGFADDILMSTMADWAAKPTKKEIQAYADALAATAGYSEDDGESAVETLMEWKNRYA